MSLTIFSGYVLRVLLLLLFFIQRALLNMVEVSMMTIFFYYVSLEQFGCHTRKIPMNSQWVRYN